MVDSREKGARAEAAAKKVLRTFTRLPWERVPGSGALAPKHGMKGDLYIPKANNVFCVEVKHYKTDQMSTSILTSANPMIFQWWAQACRQADQVGMEPLLLFKHDRSKWFVATDEEPASIDYEHIFLSEYGVYVAILEDWLKNEEIEWVKPLTI